MSETALLLTPGQIARIRQRTHLVEDVVKPKRGADSTLVHLSCVDHGQGPFDAPHAVLRSVIPERLLWFPTRTKLHADACRPGGNHGQDGQLCYCN